MKVDSSVRGDSPRRLSLCERGAEAAHDDEHGAGVGDCRLDHGILLGTYDIQLFDYLTLPVRAASSLVVYVRRPRARKRYRSAYGGLSTPGVCAPAGSESTATIRFCASTCTTLGTNSRASSSDIAA